MSHTHAYASHLKLFYFVPSFVTNQTSTFAFEKRKVVKNLKSDPISSIMEWVAHYLDRNNNISTST